jgi:hypothetical protein
LVWRRHLAALVFEKNILTLVGAYPCGRPVGQAQGRAPTQKHYLKSYCTPTMMQKRQKDVKMLLEVFTLGRTA